MSGSRTPNPWLGVPALLVLGFLAILAFGVLTEGPTPGARAVSTTPPAGLREDPPSASARPRAVRTRDEHRSNPRVDLVQVTPPGPTAPDGDAPASAFAPPLPPAPGLPPAVPGPSGNAPDGPDPYTAEVPLRVEHTATGVMIRSLPAGRRIQTFDEGGPRTLELALEGYEVTIVGPGGYRQVTRRAPAETDVLGDVSGLPDGRYKYSVSARLQSIASLSRPDERAATEGPLLADRNGRNALDPLIMAAENLQPIEDASGSFMIQNGQIVDPGASTEAAVGGFDFDTP